MLLNTLRATAPRRVLFNTLRIEAQAMRKPGSPKPPISPAVPPPPPVRVPSDDGSAHELPVEEVDAAPLYAPREALVQRSVALELGNDMEHIAPGDLVGKLKDSNGRVRRAAAKTFGRLPPEALDSAALVAKLDDSDWGVRRAALETLGMLPHGSLKRHSAALVAKLEDLDWYVREAAMEALGKLPAEALVQHSAAIVAKLEDSDMYVRRAAVETLGKLGWL